MAITPSLAAKAVCEMRGWNVSNLALQKILYVAHMVHLGRHGEARPLVLETFEAWNYGPVLPSLYRTLRMFGASPVQDVFIGAGSPREGSAELTTLREVNEFLAPLSPGQLVDMTHWQEGAWAKHYRPGVMHVPIPNHAIAEEFRARQRHHAATAAAAG